MIITNKNILILQTGYISHNKLITAVLCDTKVREQNGIIDEHYDNIYMRYDHITYCTYKDIKTTIEKYT